MRILYILPSIKKAAPATLTRELVNYMVNKGHDVTVYYFDECSDECEIFPCKIRKIQMTDKLELSYFDIIHSHMYRPDKYVFLNRNDVGKAKTISTVHCDIEEDLRYSYGRLISFVFSRIWINRLKQFDTTVQISDCLYEKYCKTLKKSVLVYNGVHLEVKPREEYDRIIAKLHEYKKNGYITVLSYSSIIARKGLSQVIEAVNRMDNIAYVCIGDGNEKDTLLNLVKKYNLEERVSFFRKINAPYNVIPFCDVYIIPSFSEGFSLALIEAGLMGASIVCSDIPSFSRAFTTNEVTFFELNNIEKLCETIDIAFQEKSVKSKNLKRKINEKYSEKRMLESYMHYYNKLLESKEMSKEC